MSGVTTPATTDEALAMLEAAWGFLAGLDHANMPAEALSDCLLGMERADAVAAAARGPMLAAFDAQDGPVAGGQRNVRSWLVRTARVTKGQAFEHQAVQRLAEAHRPLLAGLRDHAVTTSVALRLARWTRVIPEEYRARAEDPGRRRPGRRGPAGAGRDLRGDPRPHRAARPRQRPGPGPGPVPRYDDRRGRGAAR